MRRDRSCGQANGLTKRATCEMKGGPRTVTSIAPTIRAGVPTARAWQPKNVGTWTPIRSNKGANVGSADHQYLGCSSDDEGNTHARCSCGWASLPLPTPHLAQNEFLYEHVLRPEHVEEGGERE